MNCSYIIRCWHVKNGRDFLRVRFQTFRCQEMAQERNRRDTIFQFVRIEYNTFFHTALEERIGVVMQGGSGSVEVFTCLAMRISSAIQWTPGRSEMAA